MLLKIVIVGLLICLGEIINGNVRVRLLHRLYGKKRAKLISFFSGMLIIVVITWFTQAWINPGDYRACLTTGFIWGLMLICLDVYFARRVFRFNWTKIADDFNLMKGNLLSLGIILLFFMPSMVFWMRTSLNL